MTSRVRTPGGRIQTAADAAAYLEGLINIERRGDYANARLSLDPIRALLDRVDNPQRGLSILHVAGSKGKGSTCLFAENIVQCAGRTAGTFTSPHLSSWTERFRVDGRDVDDASLAAAVDQLRPHVDELRRAGPELAPTFFDATTAAALLIFATAGVDRAILEVGLGGRLDSTNAVEPDMTCITTIELEHTDKLGETLAEIAGEKAGIIKPGVECIVGPLPEEALAVVEARAADQRAPLRRFGSEFWLEPMERDAAATPPAGDLRAIDRGTYREASGDSLELSFRVLGAHQRVNAALAIAAVRRWLPKSERSLDEAVQRGIAEAELPGRLQQISSEPCIIVDSAHTVASARALSDVIDRLPAKRRLLVLSISEGKDLGGILDALLRGADEIIATRAEPLRSVGCDVLTEEIRRRRPELKVDFVADPAEALATARGRLGARDLLCVTGSVYLAGMALECLGPS